MKSYLHQFAWGLALTAGFAWGQSAQQSTPSNSPPVSSETQAAQNPKNPDQPPPTVVKPDEDRPEAQTGTMPRGGPSVLQSQIQNALQQQMPSGAGNVSVSIASDNSIQLSGTVASEDQKQDAERIAHAAAPDQTIVNNITVSSSQGTTGSTSSATMPSASSETNQTGQTTQSNVGGTATTDVQGRIQTALRQDSSLADTSITVDTKDNSVELSGTVTSKAEKQKVLDLAAVNAGGRKVIDHLKVTTSQSTPSAVPPRY